MHSVHGAVDRGTAQSRELAETMALLRSQTRWVEEMGRSFQQAVAQMQAFFSRDCEVLTCLTRGDKETRVAPSQPMTANAVTRDTGPLSNVPFLRDVPSR